MLPIMSLFSKKKQPESIPVEEVNTDNSSTISEVIEIDDSYLLTSPQVVGWLSTQEQELLFSAMLLFYKPEHSILDVGCGRADLYGYLQNIFPAAYIKYNGIDYNPNAISLAQRKFPTATLESVDILKIDKGADYDWVVGSGLFNLKDPDGDLLSYAKNVVDVMFDKAKLGVSFNLLTGTPEDMADEDKDLLFEHNHSEWLDFLIKRYGKVIARADYMLGDITFYILK